MKSARESSRLQITFNHLPLIVIESMAFGMYISTGSLVLYSLFIVWT
jgi:hypothetical protein